MPDIALFQPDIAQNLGTTLRTAACFGSHVHIIEPCGFPLDHKKLKRAGMDYIDHVTILRHMDWEHFSNWCQNHNKRLVLLSTKAPTPYTDFTFTEHDILIAGRETAGVPDFIHEQCPHRIIIPMQHQMRSLNVAVSVAIVVAEAKRQLG